jgi:hypothetical protein
MALGNKHGRFILMRLKNNEHDGYEKSQERLVDYMKFGNQSWGRGLRPHGKT